MVKISRNQYQSTELSWAGEDPRYSGFLGCPDMITWKFDLQIPGGMPLPLTFANYAPPPIRPVLVMPLGQSSVSLYTADEIGYKTSNASWVSLEHGFSVKQRPTTIFFGSLVTGNMSNERSGFDMVDPAIRSPFIHSFH